MARITPEKWYYFDSRGRPIGPLKAIDLLSAASRGRIIATTLVRREDWDKPAMAGTVKGLRDAVPQLDLSKLDETDDAAQRQAEASDSNTSDNPFLPTTLPLEDPIREISDRMAWFGNLLFGCFAAWSILCGVLWWWNPNGYWTLALGSTYTLLWSAFLLLALNILWWRAIAPRDPPNLFYLRSFHQEEMTWPIRMAIQDAVGDGYRLAGIRDPRRPELKMRDGLFAWFQAMRYCSPIHMDLETTADWKERLWNSVQKSHLVWVDLSTKTKIVREQARIAKEALGPDRVVYLGIAPQTKDEMTTILEQEFPDDPAIAAAKIQIWPGEHASIEARNQFQEEVKAILRHATSSAPVDVCLAPEWCGNDSHGVLLFVARHMLRWMFVMQMLLFGIAFGGGAIARSTLQPSMTLYYLLVLSVSPFLFVNIGLFASNWYIYVHEDSIRRSRKKAIFALLLSALAMLPVQAELLRNVNWNWPTTTKLPPSKRNLDEQLIRVEDGQS